MTRRQSTRRKVKPGRMSIRKFIVTYVPFYLSPEMAEDEIIDTWDCEWKWQGDTYKVNGNTPQQALTMAIRNAANIILQGKKDFITKQDIARARKSVGKDKFRVTDWGNR